ncbi:hypothetical protein PYW08_005348 [Mythimna loreyi]|uniref:Uncharacterized protein n=1 Tax=Mythimna loreyi TaxID=667449 RepID=A0ACC2QI92_9NEOP|nr:hypothetical protein PYW08_005348 [Mythimna loreyi]
MSKKTVLITGFGDFETINDNLSWQGVDSMDRDHIEGTYDISFYKTKIDVAYKAVENCVPKLWAEHQPDLIIHVGVKKDLTGFELETQAKKGCYETEDIENFCPPNKMHFADGPDTIITDLDLEHLRDQFNATEPTIAGLTAAVSSDAGLYLCEYIYYTSLACRGCSKTLFVHVPDKGFTKEDIAKGLERILDICLKLL